MNLRCRASSEADGRGSPAKLVPVSPVAIAVLCGLIGAGLGLLPCFLADARPDLEGKTSAEPAPACC